ncbi:MAG: ribonuclease HIII [Opitutales bacterium]|tara:strand:+ start:95 stop:1072 length:978 start_codon:yes stop_codon:yes gene_type:complete
MNKESNFEETEPKKRSLYTLTLTDAQMDRLKAWCDRQLWEFYEVDHARFAFKGDKVNVVGYKSGKLVIQGKKTEDFVTYVLEAEITQEPKMGYEEVHHPEWFEAHAGLDESGKGDLFGPLVSACVVADAGVARIWMDAGLKESKRITSDASVLKLEKVIRATKGVVVKTTFAGMEKYNALYVKFGSNLNKLLGWMHARALEDALDAKHVPWGMLDQFSKKDLVTPNLKLKAAFELRMQTKAEEDPIVAAASIIARATYIKQMKKLSDVFGEPLLKGSGAQAKEQGYRVVEKFGPESFGQFAKLHFRTASEILGKPVPEKRPWQKY